MAELANFAGWQVIMTGMGGEQIKLWSVRLCVFQAGDPNDVMYGWCHKCREKYTAEYKNLKGWVLAAQNDWELLSVTYQYLDASWQQAKSSVHKPFYAVMTFQ